ncbi:hypothetical protein [Micromonospora sp. DT229]|uniref:hypothetical protein n=1 Tax=Micromonospora sp. DT229 TaxID=3393430 RepID=UPI003CEF5ECA
MQPHLPLSDSLHKENIDGEHLPRNDQVVAKAVAGNSRIKRGSSLMKGHARRLLGVMAMLLSLIVLTSTSAHAAPVEEPGPAETAPAVASVSDDPSIMSAFGTTPIGTFKYSYGGITISVPTGCFFSHYIEGDGQMVNRHTVGTDCVGPGYWWGGFCNYKFQIKYYDLNGKNYTNWPANPGPLYSVCDYNTNHTYRPNLRYKVGKACAVFYVGGNNERARQCHNILAG